MKPQDRLLRTFLDLHPDDAARTIEAFNSDDASDILELMPNEVILKLLERLQPHVAAELLTKGNADWRRDVLTHLDPRVPATLISHFAESDREGFLASCRMKSRCRSAG